MTTLDCFLFGNKYIDERWENGLGVIAESRAGTSLGVAGDWQVAESAHKAGARSLILARKEDRSRVLALRRPIPSGRAGDQTTFGVILPPGSGPASIDALDALRSFDALSPTLAELDDMSRSASRQGGPARIHPIEVDELVSGDLPDTSRCDPHIVRGLTARVLQWWGTRFRTAVALDADTSEQVEAYLTAALAPLPAPLRQIVSFTTVERAPIPGVTVCGLVRSLDSRLPSPGSEVSLLDVRQDAGRPAHTDWDDIALSLIDALEHPWQVTLLSPATSAEDLRQRLAHVDAVLAEPALATDEELILWADSDPNLPSVLDDRTLVRLALAAPTRFQDGALLTKLADPVFARLYWSGLSERLADLDDDTLEVVLRRPDGVGRDFLLDDLLKVRSREMLHPGCASTDCPVAREFDARATRDAAFGDAAMSAGLEAPGTPPVTLARHLLLHGMGARPAPVGISAQEWAEAVRSVLPRTDHQILADRLILEIEDPARLDVIRALLATPATYEFAVDRVVPSLRLQGLGQGGVVGLLFGDESQLFTRHRVPHAVSTYAGTPSGGQPDTPAPFLPVSALAGIPLAASQWDKVARLVRHVGQDPHAVAIARAGGTAWQDYLPVAGPEPGILLDPSLTSALLNDSWSADVLLGSFLPALDPGRANGILVGNLPRIATVYGLGREFPPPGVRRDPALRSPHGGAGYPPQAQSASAQSERLTWKQQRQLRESQRVGPNALSPGSAQRAPGGSRTAVDPAGDLVVAGRRRWWMWLVVTLAIVAGIALIVLLTIGLLGDREPGAPTPSPTATGSPAGTATSPAAGSDAGAGGRS